MKTYIIQFQEKGFSLLEVLVAILLIALGIVTMVMLQSRALQYSSAAFYQGLGMQVANGLAASIRVNPDGVLSYASGAEPDVYNPNVAISDPAKDCYANTCTSAEMAAADIIWARQSMRRLLPGGDVFVRGAGNYLDVVFVWEGAVTKDAIVLPCDVTQVNTTAATNAQCLQLKVKI